MNNLKSIWTESFLPRGNQSINSVTAGEGFYKRDIVVVGGGIAGLLCAYLLSKDGQRVTLIEADNILGGVTHNTTAHVNANQGKYKDIPSKRQRREYYNAQIQAVDGLQKIITDENIDCDFKLQDSFVFGDDLKLLKKEYSALKKIGAPVEFIQNASLPFGEFSAIKMEGQAAFDPIKFLQQLPKNFEIIENVRIKEIKLCKKLLLAGGKTFKADKIILATNFPIVNIRGLYAFKMYKSSSYAVFVPTDKRLNAIFNSVESDGLTYRDHQSGVIVGGLDHRSGRIEDCCHFDKLENRAAVFGTATKRWTANDCMTFDGVPYAGKFKRLNKDVYLISGFGKWGMTNSFACAKTVADLIGGRKAEFKRLFKPTRLINIKVFHKFLFDALYKVFNIGKSLLGMVFKTPRTLKKDSGGIVRVGIKKRAVYKDERGALKILSPRCPHMRCQLKFNSETKTWDCPCHGSRFTVDGKIIVAPTVDKMV